MLQLFQPCLDDVSAMMPTCSASVLPTGSTPLRILSIAEVPPDPNAGAAGTIVFTNRALREFGHTVIDVWDHDLGRRWIRHGNLHSLIEQPSMMRRAAMEHIARSPIDVILSHQPQSYMAARSIRRAGWNGRFVVVSQGIENRIAPILSEWHARLNVPSSRSAFSMLSPLLQSALSRQWPSAARWSDGFLITNREDREFLTMQYGVDLQRTHLWHSGIPESFLSTAIRPMTQERLDRLLYVGQFAFYKAPQLLARIICQVLTANPRATMTWICHESHHAAARTLLCPDVAQRVRFSGWIKHEDLRQVFDDHGVLVFPTIAEGFGRVALEAMSRGLCVIASNCCGMRDYITDGIDGTLCPVGDVPSFIRETLRLQNSVQEATERSVAACDKARGFTWNRVASDLGAFLNRLCELPPQHSN